ncbi:MAG: lipopolysaccharide biosynthesis protein [Janthinobacterium lividum]
MKSVTTGRKVIGLSFLSSYINLAIQFVSVMVLARVLSPSEVGTFSLAAMLMAMLHVFRDFGVANYVIQEPDLTREKLGAAMGVAILLALAVAAVMYLLAWPVSNFYDNPPLHDVIVVMAASFAISPFGSVISAVLRREARIKHLFYVRTAGSLFQVGVSIAMATAGWGAISLAWGNFAGILGFGIVANLFRPKDMPRLPHFRNIGSILSFGGVNSLGNLANIAGASMPEMVVGKVMSVAAVGYFSRATGLVQLFTRLIGNALTPLVLPYYAEVRRNGQSLDKPYLMSVTQLTAVAWPFFAVLLVLAYPVTRALYGHQWDASVPVARLLCLGGAIAAVGMFASQAMIASGNVRSATMNNLIAQPIRIVAVLAASVHGLMVVAAALVVSECIAMACTCWFLRRTIGVHAGAIARACAKSVVIMACALVVPLLVWFGGADTTSHVWIAVLLGGAGAAVGWIAGLALTRHPLGEHVLPLLRLPLRRGGAKD